MPGLDVTTWFTIELQQHKAWSSLLIADAIMTCGTCLWYNTTSMHPFEIDPQFWIQILTIKYGSMKRCFNLTLPTTILLLNIFVNRTFPEVFLKRSLYHIFHPQSHSFLTWWAWHLQKLLHNYEKSNNTVVIFILLFQELSIKPSQFEKNHGSLKQPNSWSVLFSGSS